MTWKSPELQAAFKRNNKKLKYMQHLIISCLSNAALLNVLHQAMIDFWGFSMRTRTTSRWALLGKTVKTWHPDIKNPESRALKSCIEGTMRTASARIDPGGQSQAPIPHPAMPCTLLPLFSQYYAKAFTKVLDIIKIATNELTLSANPSEIMLTLPIHTF